jgi:hypothetical protein
MNLQGKDYQTAKHKRRLLELCIAFFIFVLPISVAMAGVTTPFEGKQIMILNKGSYTDRTFYPLENGIVMVKHRLLNQDDANDCVVKYIAAGGKIAWDKNLPIKGGEELSLVYELDGDIVLLFETSESSVSRLLRINSKGDLIWEKNLPLRKTGTLTKTNDGGLIIIGLHANNNIAAIKMDEQGNWKSMGRDSKRWIAHIASSNIAEITDVNQVLDEDGYNDGYIITGSKHLETSHQKDVYLLRLNAYGEVVWSETFGKNGDDVGTSVVPLRDDKGEVYAFAVAGYTESNATGKGRDLFLLHVGSTGHLMRWPGLDRSIDGNPEKYYGGSGDETGVAVYEVPDNFEGSRQVGEESFEGHGGILVVATQTINNNTRLLLVRISENGRDKWKWELDIPGQSLILGNPAQDSGDVLNIAYSTTFSAEKGEVLTLNTLKLYLDNYDNDDKSLPKAEKFSHKTEDLKWEEVVINITEEEEDLSKEINDILAQQPYRPLTAGSGWGEIEWPDLSYYLGPITVGKADGEGTLLFKNGVWYKGQWKDNMFNGTGMLRFPSGEVYQGEFKDHMMHGQGTFTWPTGEKYSGEFRMNRRDGKGVFTWPGGVVYEGDFAEDQAHGQGVIRWPNGERYEGQMTNGQATGQGSYYFPSGEWYRGEVQNLTFSGVGVYHWPDGSYFVGQFQNDRLYGEGYYVWPNGVQQWGYWKEDHYVGIHEEAMETRNRW